MNRMVFNDDNLAGKLNRNVAFMKRVYLLCLISLGLAGCASLGRPQRPFAFSELVMKPGDVISATTQTGTITIFADDELKRTYTWDGASRSARLWPRKERWYGSLGAYYPGSGSHWASVHGITRGVLAEGQMHFASMTEALEWLNSPWHRKVGAVYDDSGLFVLFSKTPGREQLNVDVFQIDIGGQKPARIPGSADGAIVRRQRQP